MAKIYISNGTTVNAGWTKHLAVSPDGVNWNAIPKEGKVVSVTRIELNPNSVNNALTKGKDSYSEITIKDNTDMHALKFNPNDVVNQATWLGNTPAKAQIAVDDITTWLGS